MNEIIDHDYLEHHGILGQKWYDRNGPPYPLNPAKDYSAEERKKNRIEKYRSKEVDRLNKEKDNANKYYEKKINKLEEKKEKALENLNVKRYNRLENSRAIVQATSDANNAMKKAEMKSLMKMSVDDLQKERLKAGLIETAGALATIGTAALTYSVSDGKFLYTVIAGPGMLGNTYKTKNRISESQMNAIYGNTLNRVKPNTIDKVNTTYYIDLKDLSNK